MAGIGSRLNKLFFSLRHHGIGGAWNLVRLYQQRQKRPTWVTSTPSSLVIETSTICNLRCTYCFRRLDGFQAGKNMGYDFFTKVIKEMPYLENLVVQGIGEPLLNPDLFEMIEFAKKRQLKVQFNTNGTLLHKTNITKILSSNVDQVCISVDTSDPERFETVRVGAKFEQVVGNIKNLVSQRNHSGKNTPQIAIRAVATKETIREADRFARFCRDLKIDILIFQDLIALTKDEEKLRLSQTEYDELMNKAGQVLGNKVLATDFNRFVEHRGVSCCTYPWDGPFVTVDGYVTPCCTLNDSQVINFGNLKDESLSTILNNDKYRAFRRDFSTRCPEVCRGCPKY